MMCYLFQVKRAFWVTGEGKTTPIRALSWVGRRQHPMDRDPYQWYCAHGSRYVAKLPVGVDFPFPEHVVMLGVWPDENSI